MYGNPDVSYRIGNVTLMMIVDGTSSTIGVGKAPNALHRIWMGHKNYSDQSSSINTRIGETKFGGTAVWPSCTIGFGPIVSMNCDYGQEFHSDHVEVCQFLFVAGHVQFWAEGLDHKVFSALLSYKGGEVVSEF